MKFYIVDVFAQSKYQGNQLAVFIVDSPLTTSQMQQIAREINFSETSFVFGESNDGYDVRIFTPAVEVPFAGHPTLGTAFIIKKLYPNNRNQVILNLAVGQITVTFSGNELSMEQKPPRFGSIIAPELMAEILHLNMDDIDTRNPIQDVSTGLPAIIVPLNTLEAVKKCRINHAKYEFLLDNITRANILVFTPQTMNINNNLHVRVFVEDPGFNEDPATGSANGNLAGWLLKYNFFNSNILDIKVEQGDSIGRPSLLKLVARKIDGKFEINVGGQVFLVASGDWIV